MSKPFLSILKISFLFVVILQAQFSFGQTEPVPESIHNLLSINVGLNVPTLVLNPNAPNGDGYKYRKNGTNISLFHCLLFKKQGILTTVFCTFNNYNRDVFFQSNDSGDGYTTVLANDMWQQRGVLTGYFREFFFNKKETFSLDMKLQAGMFSGNSPQTQINYDVPAQYYYRHITNSESWGIGMMMLTGVGLGYKANGGTTFRLGIDYSFGRIDQVVETLTETNNSMLQYTRNTTLSIFPQNYWNLNFTVGAIVQLK